MKDGIKRGGRKGVETEGRRVVGKGKREKGKYISSPFSRKKGRETEERETFKCSRGGGGGGGIRGKMGGWRKDEIVCMLKKEKLN